MSGLLEAFAPVWKTLNLHPEEVTFQTEAVTRRVYRVKTREDFFALRVARCPVAYLPDATIRGALIQQGLPVPRPIATHHDVPDLGFQWSLDSWVQGQHLEAGGLPVQVCRQIGVVLRALHGLIGSGFGKLQDVASFEGVVEQPDAGLRSRWRWAFPFSEREDQASLEGVPAELHALAPVLLDLNCGPAGVLHSDLHHQQFLVQRGQLSGVLDFADSMRGARSWDIAHFLYFHGGLCTQALLEGYGEPQLLSEARVMAVSLGTHYLGKARFQQHMVRERQARARLIALLAALA